jgi:hypothetical protein
VFLLVRQNIRALQLAGPDAVPYDQTRPMLVFSGIAATIALVTIIFFRPRYKRMDYEKKQTAVATNLNMSCE